MSIGDELWAEMTEGQKIAAVVGGRATLKQLTEGLLDGSELLRNACRDYLADADLSFTNLTVDRETNSSNPKTINDEPTIPVRRSTKKRKKSSRRIIQPLRQRFGLPSGFVSRLERHGRTVLIEKNIYRLPDGREFIPAPPSGTLGARRHAYKLVSCEQYLKSQRSSVYVRVDGKIFDYSVDSRVTLGEIFDTGYTIDDLERTGQYAPELPKSRRKRAALKAKHAAAGS